MHHEGEVAQRRILLVRGRRLTHLQLGIRPDDALALVKLGLREEAGDAVAHLDQKLAVAVAVVLEEEHRHKALP